MPNSFEFALLVMLFTWPAFVLPIILGPIILYRYKDDLSKLAAWFSLKPLLATPLWAIASAWLAETRINQEIAKILSLLPAVALTGIIVWRFKHLLRNEVGMVSLFLGADAIRWLNTFAWMQFDGRGQLNDPFFTAGWILPNVYSIMALAIVWLRSRKEKLLAS